MKKFSWLFISLFILVFASCVKTPDDNDPNLELPDGYTSLTLTQTGYNLVYGGSGNNDDETVSGMVADNQGNIYVSMNITTAQANKDVIIVKTNADGTLGWAKRYDSGQNDWSPDSGENAETGGTANSITIDSEGYVYIIFTTTQQNASQSAIVVKIAPTDGSIVWQKMWKPVWPTGTPVASQDNQGYGIDASGSYVYFTGATGTNEVIVVALNKTDGSIFFQYTLDIVQGTKDRGYVLKPDAMGSLYIGGVTGSYAYMAKITSANTASPALAWVKNSGLSYGARMNGIDIDETGIYWSCDIRGAQTYFQAMKTDFNGDVIWAKYFPAKNEDRNNTHVVKVSGSSVYVGGRIGLQSLDDYFGDGLLLKLNKTDGALEWSGIYYTGNTDEDMVEHRIKGIAIIGSDIYIAGQAWGGNANVDHFYGSWIEKDDIAIENGSTQPSIINNTSFEEVIGGEVRDGEGAFSTNNATHQNATDKTTTTPPDCDAFMMKIKI